MTERCTAVMLSRETHAALQAADRARDAAAYAAAASEVKVCEREPHDDDQHRCGDVTWTTPTDDETWGDFTPDGPCYICGHPRDHDGEPHGKVTGDGLTRDVVDQRTNALQAAGPDEYPTGYYRHLAVEQLRSER